MSAATVAAEVRAAQRRIDTGRGTEEDRQLLELDRRRWYADACAAEFGIDAYGTRALPVTGAVR